MIASVVASGAGAVPNCFVLRPLCGGTEFSDSLQGSLRFQGFETALVDGDALVAVLSQAPSGSVVVLPDADCFPARAKDALSAFLKRGGNLLVIGAAPFSRMLVQSAGKWVTPKVALLNLAAQTRGKEIVSFSLADLPNWHRSSDRMDMETRAGVEDSEKPGVGPALRIDIHGLKGWDTYIRRFDSNPIPADAGAVVLWTKADAGTKRLNLEFGEEDQSRWFAVVEASREWSRQVLTPDDFRYWHDNPSKGRGGKGDRVNFARVNAISIGLAQSFASFKAGDHTVWVADLRAIPNPYAGLDAEPPLLEAMSPKYKTYHYSGAGRVRGDTIYDLPDLDLLGKVEATCSIWRPRGLGISGNHTYRWIPLARAYDEDGRERGVCASLLVARTEAYPNARWGFIGLDSASLPPDRRDKLALFAASIARRMVSADFLLCAGADRFCCYAKEDLQLGARVAHLAGPRDAQVIVRLLKPDGGAALERTLNIGSDAPNAEASVGAACPDLPAGAYRLRSELKQGGKVVDVVEYDLTILEPPNPKPEFVTAKDGDFYVGGKKRFFIGMNYWPLYAVGLEKWEYFLHWLDPASYDPEVVERDLGLMQSLNMNLASIQYMKPTMANPLRDFLARCERHGIKVNIFVPGAHPLFLNLDETAELIKAARLWENETLFAYDIAWEPRVGREKDRKRLDPDWRRWILDQYGSFENAEKDWGFVNRSEDGQITCPTDQQVSSDGEWKRMVAAYRRFLDDLISRGYRLARERIRELDRDHLIGARTGWGGTGSPWADPAIQFDMLSGAKHLDFASPEGYGLAGEWANFERGGFTTLYGRFASGGKPVYWAEYGYNIWPDCDPVQLEEQRKLYANMNRFLIESEANGGAGWWWPGGYRVDEASDFGICNPDGTPRPAAVECKDVLARMYARPPRKTESQADVWMEIDRDQSARGYSRLLEQHGEAYAAALREGKTPGIRTAGTGTDSSDCPLVAIGNVPCNGTNPPKYLNAEFNFVEVRIRNDWRRVESGKQIAVPAGKRLELRVGLGNTGEAKWLAPRPGLTAGAVQLISTSGSTFSIKQAVPRDVPRFGDVVLPEIILPAVAEKVEIALRLEAERRTPFGEVFRLVLAPE